MRTVGLFGGGFDPPHKAHQLAALYALETQALDEVWLVPVRVHPGRKALSPYVDRVAMCELAAAALGARVRVSRAEHELAAHPGFTTAHAIDVLEYLAAWHPDTRFRLILGSDVADEAPGWPRWEAVVAHAAPIVIARAGHPRARAGTHGDAVMPAISSTAIRAAVATGLDIGELVPHAVQQYIADHALYRARGAPPPRVTAREPRAAK